MPKSYCDFSKNIFCKIQQELDKIEEQENVKILFAIESGSRAWGFPSPDSDYDVRFVYARPADWYLSIFPGRDVIECPIEDDLDINGWDVKKALQLLLKPNPVLLEWLRSPIIYRSHTTTMSLLQEFGDSIAHTTPSLYHYLHLGESQFNRFIKDKEEVSIKKYFYSLRPALALMWLRKNPEMPVPMTLELLRKGLPLDQETSKCIDGLLEKKKVTRELGFGERIEILDNIILNEFDEAKRSYVPKKVSSKQNIEDANKLFRLTINEIWCEDF